MHHATWHGPSFILGNIRFTKRHYKSSAGKVASNRTNKIIDTRGDIQQEKFNFRNELFDLEPTMFPHGVGIWKNILEANVTYNMSTVPLQKQALLNQRFAGDWFDIDLPKIFICAIPLQRWLTYNADI